MTVQQKVTGSFREVQRYRLGVDDRIMIDGVQHKWVETNEMAYILKDVANGATREVSLEEFERDLHLEKIEVDRGYFSLESIRRRARGATRLTDLDPQSVAIVMHRLRWVETFNDLYKQGLVKKSPPRLAEAVSLIAKLFVDDDRPELEPGQRAKRGGGPRSGFDDPSPSQLGRWVFKYAKQRDPMALNPNYARSGNRRMRLEPVVQRLVDRMAAHYCRPSRPTVQHLHQRLVGILTRSNERRGTSYSIPSKRTLERAIADLDEHDKLAGRYGIAWARRNYSPAFEGPMATRPLERVEMDEWRVDLMTLCVDAGLWARMDDAQRRQVEKARCWMTAAIDCATRCILSIYLTTDAPSTRSALEGLRWIVTDKDSLRKAAGAKTIWAAHGTPENLFTDKGAGFKSHEFQAAAHSLGIGTLKPNAGKAQFRGKIERLFRSLDTGLVSRFEGRTFSNSEEKGDYDAEKTASITCEELNRALIRYVCDVYHVSAHAGLGGRSPATEWNRLTRVHGAEICPPKHQMREIFGVPMQRVVGKKGVRLFGTFYQCQDLTEIWLRKRGTEVRVRVDDRDVTEISVEVAPGIWRTATAVGTSVGAVSIERLATSFADLVAAGLPAFDVDDPIEIQNRIQEALDDINSLVRHSAARAGLVDGKMLEAQIAGLRRDATSATTAWLDRRNSPGIDVYSDWVAGPRSAKSQGEKPRNAKPPVEPDAAADGKAAVPGSDVPPLTPSVEEMLERRDSRTDTADDSDNTEFWFE